MPEKPIEQVTADALRKLADRIEGGEIWRVDIKDYPGTGATCLYVYFTRDSMAKRAALAPELGKVGEDG